MLLQEDAKRSSTLSLCRRETDGFEVCLAFFLSSLILMNYLRSDFHDRAQHGNLLYLCHPVPQVKSGVVQGAKSDALVLAESSLEKSRL